MIHPKYERLRMLGEAMQAAAHAFDDPIDRIEVSGRTVSVWADGRCLRFRYQYDDSHAADGSPILGGGHWSVLPMDGEADPTPRFWARLFGGR